MGREQCKLVVLGGPMDGLEFDVDKPEATIGRRDDQDVCLPLDQAVSRRHARLILEEGEYWLEDVGSTYGTFAADSEDKVEGRVKIAPHTTFRLGPCTTLKLTLEDVEKKVVQRADRLVRRLASHLPKAPPDKWAALKDHLLAILRRMDEVNSEEEFLALLQDVAATIEEALGVRAIFGPQPSIGEPCGESPPVPVPPPAEEGLETLRSFFKSNLNEIIDKMEEEDSDEVEL